MARQARIKPTGEGTYYHLTNRIAGSPGEHPFGDVEKEMMVSLIKRFAEYFTVEILSCQVMGNHYHVVCYAPGAPPPAELAAARHNRFYEGRKAPLAPEDPQCEAVAQQMRDVSCFAGRLQQQFTSWFNRSRERPRRGTLWQSRFKSVILERDTALFNCIAYVEMNACRARLVADPADYRFGSWGEWCATGKHPFASNLERHLPKFEGEYAPAASLDEIKRRFRVEFARSLAFEAQASPEQIDRAMAEAAAEPSLSTRLNRRVRHWSDGLIIGCRRFVRETAALAYDAARIEQHRMQPLAAGAKDPPVFSWRRLRASSP